MTHSISTTVRRRPLWNVLSVGDTPLLRLPVGVGGALE
jgi:hypothetical protein